MAKTSLAVALIALVVAGVAAFQAFQFNSPAVREFGGVSHQQKESFMEGLFAGTNRQFEVTRNGDATVGGGTLTLTTSNTATSTAIVGCVQTYATSTATSIRLVIGSSGATTTHSGTAAVGVVGWQYGSCPNL